jgi:catechol 2,3-dioxygenase
VVTRVSHVGLNVTDLDLAVAHAVGVLGLRESARIDGTSYLTCNRRHHELVLMEADEVAFHHVALEVDSKQTLEELADRLPAEGFPLADEPASSSGVEAALRFQGPDGHVFELLVGMRQDQPAAYATTGVRPIKFGHATIKSPNLEAMEDFLVRILGFRLSDRMGDFFSWYRCSPDHHGIAVVGSPAGIHHYAFDVEGWPDIERLGDRLITEGRGFVYGPGRHGPGNNLFCYHLDPHGFMCEYSADLARIDCDATYEPGQWPVTAESANLWGPAPPDVFYDQLVPVPEARVAVR